MEEVGKEEKNNKEPFGQAQGKLYAPFPYYGGKRWIADKIWNGLDGLGGLDGSVNHYIEPFFGSGVTLLLRPNYNPAKHSETVCDKDGFITNVWRSIKANPEEVTKWCDWPVNHVDLIARRRKVLDNEKVLVENMLNDDDFYDAKLAGYWIWIMSCSIGIKVEVTNARPLLTSYGQGINSKDAYSEGVYRWFERLQERLRRVRVVYGDWKKVCNGEWQTHMGVCGIFFDPPYGVTDRHTNLYRHDSVTVAKEVLEWVNERGKSKLYRIVVAGYEEYEELVKEHGWIKLIWKSTGGNSRDNQNKYRERLYFSPYCIHSKLNQRSLFQIT